MALRLFTVFVESTVVTATLAEAHLLHLGNQQFYLVIGQRQRLVQLLLSLIVIHAYQRDESQVVKSLGTSVIKRRLLVGLLSIILCRVDVAIVKGIGKRIQLVHRCLIGRRTS